VISALPLALAHARHNTLRTALMVLCVAAAAFVPAAARIAVSDFRQRLLGRAESTPILIGAAGSRFDLVMASLYFRRTPLDPISMGDFFALRRTGGAALVPIHARFTARGFPIVATTPEYAELRRLAPATGTWPATIGQAALGASVARHLDVLTPGGDLHSDPTDLYELAAPGTIRLHVSAILAPTGTPDDNAVFVALNTAWILEGRSHAHADPARHLPDTLLLDRSDRAVAVSEALVEDNQVTPDNLHAFHLHGNEAILPLTALIAVPDSPRDATILRARLSGAASASASASHARSARPPLTGPHPSHLRAVSPADAVDDLLAHVLRVRSLVEGLSLLLGLLAAAVVGLVTSISARARARELLTLARIGAPRTSLAALLAWEVVAVIVIGLAVAAAAAAVFAAYPPDLANLV